MASYEHEWFWRAEWCKKRRLSPFDHNNWIKSKDAYDALYPETA